MDKKQDTQRTTYECGCPVNDQPHYDCACYDSQGELKQDTQRTTYHVCGCERVGDYQVCPDHDRDQDPSVIGCEGCGLYTPIHIWDMLGNCMHGTCVHGVMTREEWFLQYGRSKQAYLQGDLKAFDHMTYGDVDHTSCE